MTSRAYMTSRCVHESRMRRNECVGIVIFLLCLYSVIFISFRKLLCEYDVALEPLYRVPIYFQHIREMDNKQSLSLQKTLKDERNRLSKHLNDLRKRLGQMDCEKDEKKDTNEAGGWCRKSSKEDGGQHMTDMHLVKALSQFLKGKTVGSFGDGPGAYKREITKLNEVKLYDAYDGAPFCEETSGGLVKFMDLTVPQYGIPMYDWIISLEVAEHIPKDYETIYIDNIVRHSREGIIISWAVPGQGGLAHINNRPLSYVIDLMGFHGFKHDNTTSQKLKYSSSFAWFRDNVNVFIKVNLTNIEVLEKWFT